MLRRSIRGLRAGHRTVYARRIGLLLAIASFLLYACALAPTVSAASLARGQGVIVDLPWAVHYTWHGDHLTEQSSVDIDMGGHHYTARTVLGSDEVDLVITRDGETIFQQTLNHQQGHCTFGCDANGDASIEVVYTCDGSGEILYGGAVVTETFVGTGNSTAITVDPHPDARITHSFTLQCAGGSGPSSIGDLDSGHGRLTAGLVAATSAVGVALALAGRR